MMVFDLVFDDQIADAELPGEPGDLLIGDFAGHLLAEFVGRHQQLSRECAGSTLGPGIGAGEEPWRFARRRVGGEEQSSAEQEPAGVRGTGPPRAPPPRPGRVFWAPTP